MTLLTEQERALIRRELVMTPRVHVRYPASHALLHAAALGDLPVGVAADERHGGRRAPSPAPAPSGAAGQRRDRPQTPTRPRRRARPLGAPRPRQPGSRGCHTKHLTHATHPCYDGINLIKQIFIVCFARQIGAIEHREGSRPWNRRTTGRSKPLRFTEDSRLTLPRWPAQCRCTKPHLTSSRTQITPLASLLCRNSGTSIRVS
ncbi:hypothetical protein TC41_3156 [Alicyclobacillus acidocaldarius subsp. acidocaldarius Tc-4-1]|uniref:Uncharacterized protein n=1 Tax=Alicyclobacillus acidocaldarius (strain Tc-4-1) TaxID=1048834 RepID=F8ID34_ALIAT|nr:hypothetical protein TC41_3156 [Alicyclobacillus acidocaldarius subsp. acidocaldarius Tc-4-1]